MSQAGAVWSDGTQPYLYMELSKAYSKMSNDAMALASATGISSGAASTIPSLFLSAFGEPQSRLFDVLQGVRLTGIEPVEGEDCYVITGSSATSTKETFWISKSAYMIRKYAHSLESPKAMAAPPEPTDQQMEDAIKSMGLKVTPERKAEMKKMNKEAADTLKTPLKGTSTEIYTKVGTPKLTKEDFVFKVPPEAVLKESLFGGILK